MKPRLIITAFFAAVLMAACGSSTTPEPTPDIAAVRTSAASTVVSQFTLTAAAFTPTPSLPTETATLLPATETVTTAVVAVNTQGTTVGCTDDADYGNPLDVNVPDNTEMSPGQTFLKTWKIRNIGTCPWEVEYTVVYGYGDDDMNGVAQALTAEVAPGGETEVSVQFEAPSQAGTYTSYWRMSSPNGGPFGKFFSVKIIVR